MKSLHLILLIIFVVIVSCIVVFLYKNLDPDIITKTGGLEKHIESFKIRDMYKGNLSKEIERLISNILYKYTKINNPRKWMRQNKYKSDRKFYEILSKLNNIENNTSNNLASTREKLRKGNYKLKHIRKLLPYDTKKYLDFGGSDGSNASMIGYELGLKKSDILVIDQDEWIGVKINPRTDITFKNVDYLKKIKNNTFDLITCFHVLHHIPEIKETVEELKRIIKPGGTILISEHDCYNDEFANLLDVEHELFDIVVNKSVTYDEFKKLYYGKYRPKEEWYKLFKKPEEVIELKNKDMTFYASFVF